MNEKVTATETIIVHRDEPPADLLDQAIAALEMLKAKQLQPPPQMVTVLTAIVAFATEIEDEPDARH